MTITKEAIGAARAEVRKALQQGGMAFGSRTACGTVTLYTLDLMVDAVFVAARPFMREGEGDVSEEQVQVAVQAYVQRQIDTAPEPLRRLGEYLGGLLDEHQWPEAERMLLGAVTATNNEISIIRARVAELEAGIRDITDDIDEDLAEPDARPLIYCEFAKDAVLGDLRRLRALLAKSKPDEGDAA